MKPAGDVAQVHLDNYATRHQSEASLTQEEYEQLHADDYVDSNYPDERELLLAYHVLSKGATERRSNVCGLPDHLFCKCENGAPCFDTCFEIKRYVDEKVREAVIEERKRIMADLKPKIDRLEKLANRLP